MADEPEGRPRLVAVTDPSFTRTRRRQLPGLIRNVIIILLGCIVAVLGSYVLRSMSL